MDIICHLPEIDLSALFFFNTFHSMQTKAKIQVFTDFDGTLSIEGERFMNSFSLIIYVYLYTLIDTGVLLIDDERCMGQEKRKQLEHQIMDGKIAYR